MFRIRIRRNLIYLIILYITYNVRTIISIIIKRIFKLKAPYIFLFLMTLGQLTGGLAIYIYQYINLSQKKEVKYFEINIIHNRKRKAKTDNIFKKLLLVIFSGFFDFIEYSIEIFYIPKIADISPSIVPRLGCLSTIVSSLICVSSLNFKIGRHQKFSLIFLSISFLITLLLEIITKTKGIALENFIYVHVLVCLILILMPFNDCTERYLVFYNFINPFIILAGEGLFQIIISIFFSINKNPFNSLIKKYNEISTEEFALLVFLLFLYYFLSSIINVYKIYCNVIYNPMARAFAKYFLNPFFNIYFYLEEDDFHNNILYFIICEIINIIIDFFYFVYNEYIILYCCGLEHDTYDEIFERAKYGAFGYLSFESIDAVESDLGSSNGDKELNEIYD